MSRSFLPLMLLMIGVLLGVRGWFTFTAEESALVQYVGRMAVVEGVVVDDPEVRNRSVRIVVEVSRINNKPEAGSIVVALPRDTALQYGDLVSMRGMLEKPEAFETQTGRMFDYPEYLKVRGIFLIMQHAQLREVEEGSPGVLRFLYALKHTFERALERVMQEPMVSLMAGLLLGEKSGLSTALTQAFVVTGLIHIVVLSGYNIGVVAEWTLRFLGLFMSKRTALCSVGIVIVLFALMAGGGMATVRAALMGLIAIVARFLHRPEAALRALLVAIVAMLLYNPLVLFDVGFILSVLATFGLITLAPFVESKIEYIPWLALRATAATTVAVQIFVLPALLYFTGVLSFVSVPLNIVVLPFVPLAMLLGFIAGTLALVHPVVALLPGFLADTLLRGIITLTEVSAALPLASAVVPVFPAWLAVLVYIPLTLFAMRVYARNVSQPQTN